MVSRSQTLVNTVNTVGVMGKGLAADFKAQYPVTLDEYKRFCSHKKSIPENLSNRKVKTNGY